MGKMIALAQVCCLVFFAGCAAEDIDEPTTAAQPTAAPVEEQTVRPDELQPAGARAGCAYVQYCNSPDPYWGTLCVRTGCSESAAWAECRRDANYVCGGITPVFGMYL